MTDRPAKVAVIGAGTMGNGIAQVFAQAGIEVVMVDKTDEFVARGMAAIRKSLERVVKKGTMTEADAAAAAARISPSTMMKNVATADLVIEAVPEKIEIKREVFKEVDRLAHSNAILATNTSSLSITEIGAATFRPDKVIGMSTRLETKPG